jgi:hypothetical protein
MAIRTALEICQSIWFWFVQLCLWTSMILLLVVITVDTDMMKGAIIFLSITYVIYLINSLCSHTCSYLNNRKQNSTIHAYMLSLFKERPRLTFSVTCYHFETRHHTTRDKDGHVRHHTERVRVTTWSGSKDFYYLSSRDCSGLFRLDCEAIRDNPGKYFIKLHLKLDVRKSDDGTAQEYMNQRDRFFNSNRWRDQHMDTHETTSLPGLGEYTLVSIGEGNPPCISLSWFLLFTFLGFVQFYKWYVDSYCIKQEYTIVKEISYYKNLNSYEFNNTFNNFNPQIVIKNQVLLHFDDPSQLPTSPIPIDLPSSEEVTNVTNNHDANQQLYNNSVNVGISNHVPTNQFNQQMDMSLHYNEGPYSQTKPTGGILHQTSQHNVKLYVNENNFSSEPLMKKDI